MATLSDGTPHGTSGVRAPGTAVRFATSGTSAQSAALPAGEYMLHAVDARCFITAPAANPTATVAAGWPLESGEKHYIRVTEAQSGQKIAAITEGGAGFLYITPVA